MCGSDCIIGRPVCQRLGPRRGELGLGVAEVNARLVQLVRNNWLILLVVGSLIGAFLALRTRPSDIGSVAEADAILENGQPTVVEFYSNA